MAIAATDNKSWTVLSLINWSTDYFSEKGIDSPRLTTELLLSKVLCCQRIDLYTNHDKPLTPVELSKYKSFFKRRLAHEPLQYIIGECEFMGLRFFVDKRVLIPRPETEILVEQVINLMKSKSGTSWNVLEIGTGSGNIAVSLAHFINACLIDAVDVSEDALDVARLNVQSNHVEDRVKLIQADIFDLKDFLPIQQYDIIVSNPPYISRSEFERLEPEIKDFEPHVASTDNADGLTFFKAIAKLGKEVLQPGGWIFVEMAYNQSDTVSKIYEVAGYINVQVIKDYNKIGRVLKANKP
jgi:release factor glutamine methyltransferase